MTETRDWKGMKDMMARLLEERTGEELATWNERIQQEHLDDEQSLRAWLGERGVTGYAQTLLVMERFGYPEWYLASADALIDGQYADRSQLRPILDTIIAAAAEVGDIVVQARKTYVSLVTPRRTFARVQPTTRNRVDLALRLEAEQPGERLRPSRIHETMPLQVNLTTPAEVDAEVRGWLRQAYDENCC